MKQTIFKFTFIIFTLTVLSIGKAYSRECIDLSGRTKIVQKIDDKMFETLIVQSVGGFVFDRNNGVRGILVTNVSDFTSTGWIGEPIYVDLKSIRKIKVKQNDGFSRDVEVLTEDITCKSEVEKRLEEERVEAEKRQKKEHEENCQSSYKEYLEDLELDFESFKSKCPELADKLKEERKVKLAAIKAKNKKVKKAKRPNYDDEVP
jgi:hypothetical protein